MRLQNKHAVITGGSKGLGRALAQRFVVEGAYVAICARSEKELKAAGKELSTDGSPVLAVRCDISDRGQAEAFIEKVSDEFESIDILVNNASRLGSRTTIADYPSAEWNETIHMNIDGAFYITRCAIPLMMKQLSGAIINVTSSVGKAGRARWGAYAVAKFGLEGFTQVLAEELRPYNITANAVNPGAMATDMRRMAYPDEDQSLLRTPEQVTDIFVYLASDDGAGITGQSFDASTYFSNPKG